MFHDVVFPFPFALGGSGGPSRRTEVVSLASGLERRNGLWSGSRRRWDVGGGVSDLDSLAELTAFFEARRGRLYGFRFRDAADWKSCMPSGVVGPGDQLLGFGDGRRTDFALVKRYGSGEHEYVRPIVLPLEDSVRVGVRMGSSDALSEVVRGDWSLERGSVRFGSPPVSGLEIWAGYAFDVPVRFDADELQISVETIEAGRAVSVPLIEIMF